MLQLSVANFTVLCVFLQLSVICPILDTPWLKSVCFQLIESDFSHIFIFFP